jgi:hypothetical protein
MCSGNSNYENVAWLIPFAVAVALINMFGAVGKIRNERGPTDPIFTVSAPDFAAEDTHHEEDLERRQMLDSSVDEHMIKDYVEEPEERDELKHFLHHQRTVCRKPRTHGDWLVIILTLAFLCVILLTNDTPHNYLVQDETAVEGIPGLDKNNLDCTDPCEFTHVRSIVVSPRCLVFRRSHSVGPTGRSDGLLRTESATHRQADC